MKRYVAELISTFLLVFCGAGAMVVDTETGGIIANIGMAMSTGLIVMIMIFAYGRISGAHMNPVVTLSLVLLKLHPKKELFPYMIAQFLGATLASLSLWALFPKNELLGATLPSVGVGQSFAFEFILTFLLMSVILFTSQGRRMEQYFAPIAIGATVFLAALFAGPITGASMNPARSLGPALISGHFEHLWIYFSATTIGALAASMYWKWQSS